MVKWLLVLLFWLKLLLPCQAFCLDERNYYNCFSFHRSNKSTKLFNYYNENQQSPFGTVQQYEDVAVQRQIDAYLEERSQRQIEAYLAIMNESSDKDVFGEDKRKNNQEEEADTKNLMQKIKDSGVAGIISFAVVQLGFWVGTFPFVVLAFYKVTGHFPDFSNQEDMAFFGGESFAFVNVLRLAAPFRIGFALKLVPWIQENVVDRLKQNS